MGKNVKEQTQDFNDLLQAVFDSAPNGIAVLQNIYDKNGKVEDFAILLFNAYTLNWIGDVEYKGKRYAEVFPMVKETGILEKFIEVAETGAPAHFERWYNGEGMNHWFCFTAVKQGELLVITTEDITNRKQGEIALSTALDATEKQKRLYETVTNNTPDLIYVFDLNYHFTYANEALLTMWGKTAVDAIGKGLRENGYEEWHARMHEEEIDKVVATKKPIRGVVSFPHAELGSRVDDYIFAPVFNEQGEVDAIAGSTRDISDLKKTEESLKASEQTLRNLVLQSPTGICVLDAATLVSEIVNEKFVEIAGKPYEAIMGKKYWDTFAEVAPYYESALQEVIDKGEAFYANEVQMMLIRHGKEEIIYVTFVYEPMKDSNGSVKKVVVWVLENTMQVNARRKIEESESRYKILAETLEQQVNERTQELQRSNEDLQQFAHVASHDLKEPVRKVKTFTSRLEQHLAGKLDETAVRYIQRIHVATNRMFTMIDGVLAYSTTNAYQQSPQPVDLNETMKNIETDLEVIIQKTGTRFQYNHLPTIEGAPVLLYQLFYNLANNAIKFAKADVPSQINITSETIINDGREFEQLVLSDNGIGFAKEYETVIFDTFTRLNSKDKYEGTGLGLALCKKIVERHGGSIAANGVAGEGAAFTILLPVHQNDRSI